MEVGLLKIIIWVNGSWIDENKLHIKLPIQFNKYVMLHSYSSGGKSSGGEMWGANLPGANCPYPNYC